MGFAEKWKRCFNRTIFFAFDRDRLWSGDGPGGDGAIRSTAACVAIDAGTRRVAAIGDEAHALRERKPDGITFVDYVQAGAFDDVDVAESAIRNEIRKRLGRRLIAPRILVASPGSIIRKRVINEAMVHAGGRQVITIPVPMAAAIGAGCPVESDRLHEILYFDRDWTAFALICRGILTVHKEIPGGIDQLMEDEFLGAHVSKEGLSDTGASTIPLLLHRIHLHRQRAVAGLSDGQRNGLTRAPLYLTGPCASRAGLADGIGRLWNRQVVRPDNPGRVVIDGCYKVMENLDWIIRPVKGAASRVTG
ncbi:actin-like ATPase involved in cell morphogenesis [Opitutaceae bacterium TAV1]|nr:actin-like ATPase involved in cell morphogenesis [Opitutaceae bacterium TAV1]